MFRVFGIIGIFIILLVGGCFEQSQVPTAGGRGSLDIVQHTTETAIDGTVKDTTKTFTIGVAQPEDPKSPASLGVDLPDGTHIKVGTGNSFDLGTSKSSSALLSPLTWIGGGLIVLGLVVALLLHQLLWGLVVGGTGIGLITGAFLLNTYPLFFLVGFCLAALVGVAYVGYLIWKFKVHSTANTENVKLIDELKKYMSADAVNTVFNGVGSTPPLVDSIHSPTTSRLVNQIKASALTGKG